MTTTPLPANLSTGDWIACYKCEPTPEVYTVVQVSGEMMRLATSTGRVLADWISRQQLTDFDYQLVIEEKNDE